MVIPALHPSAGWASYKVLHHVLADAVGGIAGTGACLTSIPGAVVELRSGLPECGSSGWEAEAQGAVVPPGDGDVEVGVAGVDEYWVVAAQVERAGHGVVGEVQGAAGVEEVAPDGVRGGGGVAGELAGSR
jgi:hypothetical protein